MNAQFQEHLKCRLEATDKMEVVAKEVVWNSEVAKCEFLKLTKVEAGMTIFKFAVDFLQLHAQKIFNIMLLLRHSHSHLKTSF
jgi:hypothetical protein